MKPVSTKRSLAEVIRISNEINNQTFHHHYHILYDIANLYPVDYSLTYVEIGCYAGGSACLLLQRKNTTVISIDLGQPVDPIIVKNNVNFLNKHNNPYIYLQKNSHSSDTPMELNNHIQEIDILFIDGDHSFDGVIKDFEMYSEFVKSRGYVVFDDYNDSQHSPEVKSAVDFIVSNFLSEYNVIGTIKNILGARPVELIDGNCFIIQKL